MEADPIRAIVVSVSAVFGAGVVAVLEEAGMSAGAVTRAVGEVTELVDEHRPHVVVAAIDGGDAAEVVAVAQGTPVLVIGTGDAEHVVAAIRGRANGFVAVDETPDALVDAVRSVAAGRTVYPLGWQESVLDLAPAPPVGVEILTPRERDIVELILDGRSNKDIARTLGLAQQTVKNQLGHILLKLGLSSRLQLYRWATENGVTPWSAGDAAGGAPRRPY